MLSSKTAKGREFDVVHSPSPLQEFHIHYWQPSK